MVSLFPCKWNICFTTYLHLYANQLLNKCKLHLKHKLSIMNPKVQVIKRITKSHEIWIIKCQHQFLNQRWRKSFCETVMNELLFLEIWWYLQTCVLIHQRWRCVFRYVTHWRYCSLALNHRFFLYKMTWCETEVGRNPDSKVHGANMGPIWGRQDPGGPHVVPMNLAIREILWQVWTWYSVKFPACWTAYNSL